MHAVGREDGAMRNLMKTRLKAWLFGLVCAGLFLAPFGLGRARADDGGSELREAERSVVRVLAVHFDETGQVVALVGGTGFVVAPGKIITNNHVIAKPDGVSKIVYYVVPDRFAGSAAKPAEVQEAWPQSDLAILSAPDITAPILHVAATPPGKEAIVRAMGYPGVTDEMRGLAMKERLKPSEPYVTSGSIALFSDTAPGGAKLDTIFHTAAIDHGNSGGPLLDQCGRLIGINTWSAAGAVSSDGSVESHPGQYAAIGASVMTRLLATVGVDARVENAPCVLGAGGGVASAQPAHVDTANTVTKPAGPAPNHGRTLLLSLIGAAVLVGGAIGVASLLQRQNTAFSGGGGGASGAPALSLGPTAFLALGVGVLALIGVVYLFNPPKAPPPPTAPLAVTTQPVARPGASLSCAFAADQSLNPMAQAGTLSMSFDPALGCLNGHSAYAMVDGRYVRLTVNEKDHIASRLEMSGDMKTFTRRDYALGDEALAAIAADRQSLGPPNCPVSADAVSSTETSDVAAQVRTMLSSTYFNGEPARVMTWRCTPPVQAQGAAPATTALDAR
jgi:serine protease Do